VPLLVPGCTAQPPEPILDRWATLANVEEYAAFLRAFIDEGTAAHRAGQSVDAAVAGACADAGLRPAGSHVMKGLASPVSVWTLTTAGDHKAGRLS
jgi:hypothetical protein